MDGKQELALTSEGETEAGVSNDDSYDVTEDTPLASNLTTSEPEINVENAGSQNNEPERFVLIIEEVLVKLEDILCVFKRTRYSDQNTDVSFHTPPNDNRNMRPDDEQSSQTPQILEIPAENNIICGTRVKPEKLTIDTREQSQALIPNPREHLVLQVDRNAMMAQRDNSNESNRQVRRMRDGRFEESRIQGGEYRNHNNFGNMRYDLNNQQQRYYSPLSLETYGQNQNPNILHRQVLFISQAVRPNPMGWIYLTNQNNQELWNGQIHRNSAMTQLIPRNDNNLVQRNIVQGTYENRGINPNIQLNVNHQWQGNRPPMYGQNQNLQGNRPPVYGHNQNLQGNRPPMYGHNQNFNTPHEGTSYSQGTWNSYVRGNIPMSQNFQHGWNSQRPHNDRMPQSGNRNNFPRFSRISGRVHQNHMNFGNMHNLNIQQGYRPRAYGQNQNINFPQAQEMYGSNRFGPTNYVTNFTLHQNDEGGYGPSVRPNGMGAFGNRNDNGYQRGGRNPRREN